jgi:outer membrane protein insertion porin family
MKKKYSAFTLACCVKRKVPGLENLAHRRFAWLACLVLIGTSGCQSSRFGSQPILATNESISDPSVGAGIDSSLALARHLTAKPPTQPVQTGDQAQYGTAYLPNSGNPNAVQQTSYQYPAAYPPGNRATVAQAPVQGTVPGPAYFPVTQLSPQGNQPPIVLNNVQDTANVDVFIPQNPSSRFNIGGTYNSDNSFLGQIVIEDRDFDIPRRLGQITDPRAWRGGGKTFRLEAMPGNEVQRYLISLANPYFRGTENSVSVSGYFFDRNYFDWDEQRAGGRIALGRQMNQFLSFNAGLRLESVDIKDPRLMTSPDLNSVLGTSNLFLGSVGFVYDSRFDPVESANGSYLALKYTIGFGDYSYSRGDLEYRIHQLIYQRPDCSGRHILSYKTKLGVTGGGTPVFENFYAGGFSSLRGFAFRGVSPIQGGVRVGGEFMWVNSLEYSFPLTADDMIHGVGFVDFGTVEENVEINSSMFRAAPGVGLRVHVPFAGTAAPLAFDWAFPVATATGDDKQTFSFYLGLLR